MGKRVYTVEFHNVAIVAVEDLIAIYCGASMAVELHGIVIGQITNTSQQNLNISIKRLAATVTSGSGGSAATPQKTSKNDAAATATARINDTTQATSSGVTTLHSDVFSTINGYQFFWTQATMPDAALSEALVLSLNTAPVASMNVSGTLYFAEKI